MRILLTLFVVLPILGCNPSDDSSPNEKVQGLNYKSNLDKWVSGSINSYSFKYQETGFSPLKGPWEIQVHKGEVIYISYVGDTTPTVELETVNAPSINVLFERIASCDTKETCAITELNFDAEHSFPTNYYESWGQEGGGFTVTDFVVQ